MPEEIFFLSASSIAAATFLLWGLMRSVNLHLDRKHRAEGADSPALRAEIEELRAQLEGVDELRERVADLEERTDFNERILAQQRASDKLPPAKQ